jgi:tyrosine decarboxylase/aspartate 1-decarboxylase
MKKLGLRVIKPTMNILVFGRENQDAISKGLADKGWSISRTAKGEIRLVIMPHVTEESVNAFVGDLKEILPLV